MERSPGRRKVVIVEIIHPNEFLGFDQQSTSEMEQLLHEAMNTQLSHGYPRICKSEMYAIHENGLWKRVLVKDKYITNDAMVSVEYLDYGFQGSTIERRLKKLPEHLKFVSASAKRYSIPDLIPLRMETFIETSDKARPIKAERRRSRQWCGAAMAKVNQVLTDADHKVEVEMLDGRNGSYQSSLSNIYCNILVPVGKSSKLTSISEILVEERFAMPTNGNPQNGYVEGKQSAVEHQRQRAVPNNGTHLNVPCVGSRNSTSPRMTTRNPTTENPEANGFRKRTTSNASSDELCPVRLMQCHNIEGEGMMDDQLDGEAMKRAVFHISVGPIPPPLLSYDKGPLPPSIKKYLLKNQVKCFLFIQANMCPVILRGMDVLAVAPKSKGKTTGLLISVLTRLVELMENPRLLKQGPGPVVIIVCPSWSKVEKCADYAHQFLGKYPNQAFRDINLVRAYGGSCESNTEIKLMSGCELLIITAPCLLRLLNKSELVELRRLEMIAFDDMDVLCELYQKEIKDIFLHCQRNKNPDKKNPQVVTTASTWTPAISDFSKICMHHPVELYTLSAIQDACVRLQIPHFAIQWKGNHLIEKLQALTSFLRETATNTDSIVICTHNQSSAQSIRDYLKEQMAWKEIFYVGDDDSSDGEIRRVSQAWTSLMNVDSLKKPVLVLVDSKDTRHLTITNATILVHFDLPAKADSFYRYYYIRSGMQQYANGIKNATRCYFLYNEEEWTKSPINPKDSIDKICETIRYLRKLRTEIPKNLLCIANGRKISLELQKGSSSLCYYLRAFGVCQHPSCDSRHVILGDIDAPQLPNSGELHFKVLYAKSANHFFVRVLKHRSSAGVFTNEYQDDFPQIQLEMNSFFSKLENQHVISESKLFVGAVVAVQDGSKTLFKRARVLVINRKKVSKKFDDLTRVTVQYLDEGQTEVVHRTRLMELPKFLTEFCPQAVEVFVSRCRPIDKDTVFSPEATEFVSKLLADKEFFGKIALCVGRTIWMNIVAEHVYYRETQVHVVDHNIRSMLLDKGFAVDNESHLKNLYHLCKGKLDIPKPGAAGKYITKRFTYGSPEDSPIPISHSILEDDDITEAFIGGALESPDVFYVIRSDIYDLLWELSDEIEDHSEYVKRFETTDIDEGTMVLCLWETTQEWNRGKILCRDNSNVQDLPSYRVFFIDFGDTDTVSWKNIRQLPNEFRKLPAAAVECSLANCQPANKGSWNQECRKSLMDFFYTGNDRQPVDVSVVSKCESQIDSSRFRYVVNIVQQENELDLTYHLIAEGIALGNADFAERLFPKDEIESRISPLARRRSLVHLAFDLIKCIDFKNRRQLAESIYSVIVNWEHQQPLPAKKLYGVEQRVSMLIKLIHYTSRFEELYFLYRALEHLLVKSKYEINCENEPDIISHIVFHVQRLSKKTNSTNLSVDKRIELVRTLGVILELVIQHSSNQDMLIRIPQWITSITDPIDAEFSTKIRTQFMNIAIKVLTFADTASIRTLVDCVDSVFDQIDCSAKEWSVCLELIEKLSSLKISCVRKMFEADFMTKIWSKMETYHSLCDKDSDCTIVDTFINAFHNLWTRSAQKKRADLVQTKDCRSLIERLMHLSNSKLLRSLLFDINLEISRMKKSDHQTLDSFINRKKRPFVIFKPEVSSQPIEVANGRRQPHVRWFQGRKYIFLIVYIPQQHRQKICPVIMTDKTLHLNCLHQGEVLAFDMNLFYSVEPENCLVKITEHEIRLKLKKKEIAQEWPRLMNLSYTPQWLSKDLEHLDYETGGDTVGVTVTEEAEEASGFTLPALNKVSDDKFEKLVSRIRERSRRKLRRSGKKSVGKPPDVDASAWIFDNFADQARRPVVDERSSANNNENGTQTDEDKKTDSEEDNCFSDDSSDDDFFAESESDDNIEIEPQQRNNPALEDCSDHFYHW